MIHPVEERQREARVAEAQPRLAMPERLEGRSEGRVAQHHGEHGHEDEQQSRGGRPPREIHACRVETMPEGAEQRLGERGFVPRALVPPAVDEERGRHAGAAAEPALRILAHAVRRAPFERGIALVAVRNAERSGDPLQLLGLEDRTALHERIVHAPEVHPRGRRVLGHLRRARGLLAIGEREMSEDVAQASAEAVAQMGDDLVRGVAVGAGVAAVLDERDRCRRVAEEMVHRGVDRAVEACGACVGHVGTEISRGSPSRTPRARPGPIASGGGR